MNSHDPYDNLNESGYYKQVKKEAIFLICIIILLQTQVPSWVNSNTYQVPSWVNPHQQQVPSWVNPYEKPQVPTWPYDNHGYQNSGYHGNPAYNGPDPYSSDPYRSEAVATE